MSAIGREGGHSRGARARAASQGGNTTSDFAHQNTTGNQSFAHEVTSERGAFEGSRAASNSGTQRSSYGGSERGNSRERNDRNERESDRESDHGPFSGRGEI